MIISQALSLEGYLAAKVMVEALRKAGANPTKAKVLEALNGIAELELGGYTIKYLPGAHTGSTFADISIVGTNGRLKN